MYCWCGIQFDKWLAIHKWFNKYRLFFSRKHKKIMFPQQKKRKCSLDDIPKKQVYALANYFRNTNTKKGGTDVMTPSALHSSHSSSHGAIIPCAGVTSFETVGKECMRELKMLRMEPTHCPFPNCRTHYSTTSVPGMKQHLLQTHQSRDVDSRSKTVRVL